MPGTLFVVATPIGNLEDITARALRVLRESTVIAAEDTRRTAHLLARYAITTPSTSLHEHNESQKTSSLIARLQRGEDVALVSDAGTPTIADPGQQLIGEAIKAGLRVESIPGPNAAIAALAVSGFSTDSFYFMGFPPTKASEREEWCERARQIGGTIVFYEAPHRLRETLLQFQRLVGDCQIVVCREMTKAHEELVRGPISEVAGPSLSETGEFTIVASIGDMTKNVPAATLADADALVIFGQLTLQDGVSRRRAINVIARRYNMPPNEVYTSIERAKKSAE